MAAPSRRLTTLWFADIAGFTRLSATDEPLALRAMDVMRSCVKAAVAAKHGKVIKYLGDGALAEFPSAEGAVAAALEAGARFKGGTRAFPGGPFQLHIGIHVGDVTVGEGDIYGDGVNRAARLQSLGDPGEVLISEEVFTLVRRRPELKLTPLGERTAKGLDEPFLVYSVQATGELAARLDLLEKAQPSTATRAPVKVVPFPRAVAVGMVAALVTFGGLALWTALGGTADDVAAAPAPIPAVLPLPAHDSAFAMPVWPAPPTPRAAGRAAPAGPPESPTTLAGLTRLGEAYLRRLSGRDLAGHEALPLLRWSLDEARAGGPTGGRAEAIRGITLFVAGRDLDHAETAFHSAIATDAKLGLARVMYAQLLTAQGRFAEARSQLEQAKGKGVSDALIERTRGAVLFRERDYDDAQKALDRSLDREDVLATRILLARTLIAQGKVEESLRVLDGKTGSPDAVPWRAYARMRADERQGADVQPRITNMAAREKSGYAGALILLEAGETDRALAELDRLRREQDPDLLWLGVDPEWAPLRNDARFRTLVQRVLGRR